MTTKRKTRGKSARRFLEDLSGGPLTLGDLLEAIRLGEDWSQVEFAKRLGISRSHLCDIEKGRKLVSPERAAHFADKLGYSKEQFVGVALQEIVDEAGLEMTVKIDSA